MQLQILIIAAECKQVVVQVGRHVLVELLHGREVVDDVADYCEVCIADRPDHWQQLAASDQLEGEVVRGVVQED